MMAYAKALRALNIAVHCGPEAAPLVRRLAYVLEDAHRESRAINAGEWLAVKKDAQAAGVCVDDLAPR